MANVTGKDIVDIMAEGISANVKDHIRDRIVNEMVEDFKGRITEVVDEKLSEMVFNAYSRENPREMRKELALLIEWTKGQAEYKKKYSLQSEIVEA